MARCQVCDSPDRGLIDLALAADKIGMPALGKQFGVGHYALRRHRLNHLPATLARGAELAEDLTAAGIVVKLQDLQVRTDVLLKSAEEAGDLPAAAGMVQGNRLQGCASVTYGALTYDTLHWNGDSLLFETDSTGTADGIYIDKLAAITQPNTGPLTVFDRDLDGAVVSAWGRP